MSGIVRKIDELGRIVIPKEIRKTLRIKDGEALEIIAGENTIILKKYSEMQNFKEIASKYIEVLSRNTAYDILVSDRDTFFAGTGLLKKEYVGHSISSMLETMIENRQNSMKVENEEVILSESDLIRGNFLITAIRTDGDIIGLFIVDFHEDKITDDKVELIKIINDLLVKNIEE